MLDADEAAMASPDDAVEDGMGFPKKYDRIWASRMAFMNTGSRSTQPPDFESLITEIRSSDAAADALVVGLLS